MAPRFICAILALAAGSLAGGQIIMEPKDRADFNTQFDQFKGAKLDCNSRTFDPYLDFGLRFELRYQVDCEIRQFGGVPGQLKAFLRVRPEGGKELLLGEQFLVPAPPHELTAAYLKKVHAALGFSGVLVAGIGVYNLELLLVDNQDRVYRRHWKAKAFPHGRENKLPFTLRPTTVASMTTTPIPAKSVNGGSQLTVLLDAAPMNPWSQKLRAWDRAFLLDSLSSLLRQLPYSSVRVIAFNLDQQAEIYRRQDFAQADMASLAAALRNLELGTIEYSKLANIHGWADLLTGLLKEEAQSPKPSDAVIVLGPTIRLTEKMPVELLAATPPPLFCITYYPRVGYDFPDSLQYLTAAFKGKVFRIHSPSELVENLAKLQREVEGDTASARTTQSAK